MASPATGRQDSQALSDEDLARQARTTLAAFDELYRRRFQSVYRYHVAHTGNVHDAEDLTTQTFLAALEGISQFRGQGSFAAWLLGIARHKTAMFFRARKPQTPLDSAIHVADPGPDPELVAVQSLQLDQAIRSLRHLAPDRAEALRLCIFGGLTAREAAQAMGKSEAAVKMLVSRGLKDIRERAALAMQEES